MPHSVLVCFLLLFRKGWLRNEQRYMARAESLYQLLNPLFCDVFVADVVSIRFLLLWPKSVMFALILAI